MPSPGVVGIGVGTKVPAGTFFAAFGVAVEPDGDPTSDEQAARMTAQGPTIRSDRSAGRLGRLGMKPSNGAVPKEIYALGHFFARRASARSSTARGLILPL